MNFWNDKELALRFKNNQVPSQERLLYYIVPFAIYAFLSFFALGVINFFLSAFMELSPVMIFQGKILHFFEGLIQSINSYYTSNANRTLSEIIPQEIFNHYKTSFDTFIHSKTSFKDMAVLDHEIKNEVQIFYNEFIFGQISDIIICNVLPISGILLCYKTNKVGDDKEFLERLIALSFPIAVKAFCVAIPVYIISSFIMGDNIVNVPFLIVVLYFYWQLNTSIKIASSE